MANNKNLQFLPYEPDIQAILPTHELIIFTKFHFLFMAYFRASNIIFASVYIDIFKNHMNWELHKYANGKGEELYKFP